MDQIDEFESMFRRAEREPFGYEEVPLNRVTLVTDGTPEAATAVQAEIEAFLPRLPPDAQWRRLCRDDFHDVARLLERIGEEPTDILITYRHLQEESLIPQHSLGVFLDVLTQATDIPVLVLPGTAGHPISLAGNVCDRVLLVTDHIAGDDRLINHGVRMCAAGGKVWLCHVEDDAIFSRYMAAIERIPEIDSVQARDLIDIQLVKNATDFIETCLDELNEKLPSLTYRGVVERGHHLNEYRKIIAADGVDLVVANTKDEGQLAMHGMAYSMAVELLETPLLLL
jgi:hypothetical protein